MQATPPSPPRSDACQHPPSLVRPARVDWDPLLRSTTTRRGWMLKRILFVEDNSDFRVVFTQALGEALAPEQLDVAFVEAGSLAEARVRLRAGGLDAALIDVTMPDGNGLDLLREINDGGATSYVPTLVVTA